MSKEVKLKEALAKLRKELREDKGYYIGWKANIAMAFQDELSNRNYKLPDQHEIADAAAKNFLDLLLKNGN